MALLPGATVPPLFLPRLGGGQLPLPRGPALIFFFRGDCEACPEAAAAVARIAEALQPRGLSVVGISQDDAGDTAAFVTEHGLGAIELALDPPSQPASSAFELDRLPSAFVVDEGVIAALVEGWSRHDYHALGAAAAALVNAPAPQLGEGARPRTRRS